MVGICLSMAGSGGPTLATLTPPPKKKKKKKNSSKVGNYYTSFNGLNAKLNKKLFKNNPTGQWPLLVGWNMPLDGWKRPHTGHIT